MIKYTGKSIIVVILRGGNVVMFSILFYKQDFLKKPIGYKFIEVFLIWWWFLELVWFLIFCNSINWFILSFKSELFVYDAIIGFSVLSLLIILFVYFGPSLEWN